MRGGGDNKHGGVAAAVAARGHYYHLESPGIGLGEEAGDPAGVTGSRLGSEVTGGDRQQRSGDGDSKAPAVSRREDLGRSLPARGRRPPRRIPAAAAAIAFGRTDGSRVNRKELEDCGIPGAGSSGRVRRLEQ